MKKLTGLILNGGFGVRLKEVTEEKTPKGHIEFNGRPLISYHIEMLKKLGVDDIVMAYTHESQVKQLRTLIKQGKVPDLPYIIDVYVSKKKKYHPTLAFTSTFLKSKIYGKNVLKIHSDNVFYYNDLYKLYDIFKQNKNTTFAISPDSKIFNKKDISRLFANENSSKWNSGGVTILNSESVSYIFSRIEKNTFSENPDIEAIVLKHLLRKGIGYNIYRFSKLINMNTYEDYVFANRFLKE